MPRVEKNDEGGLNWIVGGTPLLANPGITATANVNLPMIRALHDHWRDDDAEARHDAVTAVRAVFQRTGAVIPAMKGLIARRTGEADWATVRPPLRAVTAETLDGVERALGNLGLTYAAPDTGT